MTKKWDWDDKRPSDRKEGDKEEKVYDYEYCEKHKIRYPKGTECPKCKEEDKD